MINRWPIVLALSLPALAQIQVFQFDGVKETVAGALADIGIAAPGDTLIARFKAKNIGTGPAIFSALSISGAAFTTAPLAPLPYTIAPGSEAEFRVSFAPSATGTYSAFLMVNSISLIVRGTSVAAAVLTVGGGVTPLSSGALVDFGSVVRGSSRSQSFTLINPSAVPVSVATLSVTGAGFSGGAGIAPVQIAAGKAVTFQIAFNPQSPQAATGTLSIDQRSFTLTGLGLDPPLPTASIVFATQTAISAQQNSISIPLAAVSQVSATGTLSMQFHAGVTGVTDDPAIQFLSGPKRSATVTINAGDATAKFGTQNSMPFQTGTTAGTIVFTLTLPNASQQTSLIVTPTPVLFDTIHGVRRVNDLDVSITGYDNTYSVSQLAFTFYDAAGAIMQPGTIRVDAAPNFRLYYASTPAGGAFAFLATFPVTGDATQVSGVDVQMANSAGISKTNRILF
jgi:hypothetical protein